jgi:phosphohistidine phosphatase
MRTLLVLRHAKSDWEVGAIDHARPLAKRGRKAAARIGRFISVAGPRPDIVVTSTATRASETVARAAKAGGWTDVPVHATEALYETTPAGALAVVRALPDQAATAMIVGHEPTLSELVTGLIGGGSVVVTTGTLVTLEFDAAQWGEVDLGSASLERLISPRSLEGLCLRQALERRGPFVSAGREAEETRK